MGLSRFALAVVFILLAQTTYAAPEEVYVGLYLLDVSKYDVRTGEFTADFYLSLYCDENCSPEGFEFMNGRATTVDMSIDESDEKFYRIQGVFGSHVDMERYPFDTQKLQIIIEDKLLVTDDLVYLPVRNESGIDDAIIFPGWEVKEWTVSVDEHYYSPWDETYSRYTYTIEIERITLNALLKTFVPLFFMILITLASLMLSPKEMGFRITIGGSTLITTVLLHLSILSEIPPTPYLTFTDKFMFVTYTIVLLSFLVNIYILELKERKKERTIDKVQKLVERLILLVPLVYILLFYLLLS
jgi:hypothetical protein